MRKLNEVLKQDKYNKYFNTAETNLRSKNKIDTTKHQEVKKRKIKNIYEDFDTTLFNNFM